MKKERAITNADGINDHTPYPAMASYDNANPSAIVETLPACEVTSPGTSPVQDDDNGGKIKCEIAIPPLNAIPAEVDRKVSSLTEQEGDAIERARETRHFA